MSADEGRRSPRRGGNRPPMGDAAPGTPEFFAEQYRSLAESLERGLEERVRLAGGGRPPFAGAAGHGAAWRQRLVRWRPEIYFLATVLLVLGLWWRGSGAGSGEAPAAAPGPPAATRPVAGGADPPPVAAPDPVPQDPERAWRDLVARRRAEVAAWLAAAARREGLAADQISDFQAAAFSRRAATVAAGAEVDAGDLANIRRGLFEYAYALAESAAAGDGPRRARVTLGFTGFSTEVLAALLADLGLDDAFAPPHDPADAALQVAVIARWLERRPPPEPAERAP